MLRSIVSVVVGYIALAVVLMITMSVAFMAMGVERAFKPGSWDTSTMWAGTSLALGLVAAILGGLVCVAIAKRPKPPIVLAGILLALGVAVAVYETTRTKPDPTPRTANASPMEARRNARQPAWVAWSNPIIGFVGVLIGSRLVARKPA